MSLRQREMTPALIAANRANAKKSTGPGDDGKRVSRCNALVHWGRAETIRPFFSALGDDAAEYDAIRDGLLEALDPHDAFEALLVGDMIEIHWRLRRLIRGRSRLTGR